MQRIIIIQFLIRLLKKGIEYPQKKSLSTFAGKSKLELEVEELKGVIEEQKGVNEVLKGVDEELKGIIEVQKKLLQVWFIIIV